VFSTFFYSEDEDLPTTRMTPCLSPATFTHLHIHTVYFYWGVWGKIDSQKMAKKSPNTQKNYWAPSALLG